MRHGGLFSYELLEVVPGRVIFRCQGKKASQAFAHEAGGHRWQRVPPTEKRGRVHTSTVTVAVLPEPTQAELVLRDSDLELTVTRSGGPGGQHRQKNETAVVVTHKPTGLTVRCENERSQYLNRERALAILRARLFERQQSEREAARSGERRRQVGSGMRGDKRRTIRTQDGVVTDHVLGERWPLKRYLRGEW